MSQKPRRKAVGAAALVVAVAMLAFAGSASAKLTGAYTQFAQCPYTTAGVEKCLYSPTEGGTVKLGSKTVPITNPAVLQGGIGAIDEKTGFAPFFAAKNGITLSKAPQKVPGGLAGFVKCNEITNFLLRITCEGLFENGLTGVDSTLELAQGASGIKVNEEALGTEEGTALRMPVRVHLENPLFGSECFVGSASTPIVLNLTVGFTPDEKLRGKAGKLELLEEGSVLRLTGSELVDNTWSAPGASGCGGLFSFIINPIVNSSSGLPSAAGNNYSILKNTINVGAAAAVALNDKDNP